MIYVEWAVGADLVIIKFEVETSVLHPPQDQEDPCLAVSEFRFSFLLL